MYLLLDCLRVGRGDGLLVNPNSALDVTLARTTNLYFSLQILNTEFQNKIHLFFNPALVVFVLIQCGHAILTRRIISSTPRITSKHASGRCDDLSGSREAIMRAV